jgi:hypothetical protein
MKALLIFSELIAKHIQLQTTILANLRIIKFVNYVTFAGFTLYLFVSVYILGGVKTLKLKTK